MRLWLLSLVAGITLGVAGTPLGKVSTGREQAEEEKERQDSLEPNSALNSLHIPENEKRNLSEALERIEEPDPYKKSLGTLNLPRTILLQLLNHTKAMKRNSEMDLTHWNLNGSITRDLCKGCCKEKEKPNLSRQSVVTSKRHSRERRPGQWTILGSMPLPLGNSSINMVMMFHNGTHTGYQDKKVTQQTEDLRRGWCSGCCKDGETLEVLERREGEEVREVPPAWEAAGTSHHLLFVLPFERGTMTSQDDILNSMCIGFEAKLRKVFSLTLSSGVIEVQWQEKC
ncbi:uncharacterized protein [Notamacropus eugenii]|uniref:uncharacterized protein isoform X4 n=1 Tax=Notamacropus eugenii TaxID=9315 RepID=UPI003B67ACE1